MLQHNLTRYTFKSLSSPIFFFFLSLSFLAINYNAGGVECRLKTAIVSSGSRSPALRLSQHFISSNLLIGRMDYEQPSVISRFLALFT